MRVYRAVEEEAKGETVDEPSTETRSTPSTRVHLTGGRSNRSGPVPVWAGTKPVQIQNLNLDLKK